MKAIRQAIRIFLCSIVLLASPMLAQAEASTAPSSTATVLPAKTNEEIRQWYNDQVALIPALDALWAQQGLTPEQRAQHAYDIRHHARLMARLYMQNLQEVADLQARDREKYGNPDGPTFDSLVQKNRDGGMTGDDVYLAIVGSANRTSAEYNARYNVQTGTSQ